MAISFESEQAAAILAARLGNIQHLLDNRSLLGDRSINPADVHATRWIVEINEGRMPSEAELKELDRGGWPVGQASDVVE